MGNVNLTEKSRNNSSIKDTVRDVQVDFAEKHWLLTWAHKLTKKQEKLGISAPFCICFCCKPFSLLVTLQSPWIPKRTKLIIALWQWTGAHLELLPSQWGQLPQESSQAGTRFLPLGDNFQNWTRPPASPRLPAPPVMTPTRPHLCLDCLCITLSPAPSCFVYLNL
jgi:hypothetical protein